MDAELLAQYRSGSETAFADIVRRHTPWVYSLALRGCGDAHLAEDVVQAVFILLHRKAPAFIADGAMINWLHKVARYAAATATAARSERRRQKREFTAAKELPHENTSSEWLELAPLLDQLIDRLPQTDRQAVLLRYFLDLSFADVAAQMNSTTEAARKRVDRAVKNCAGSLKEKAWCCRPQASCRYWQTTSGLHRPLVSWRGQLRSHRQARRWRLLVNPLSKER